MKHQEINLNKTANRMAQHLAEVNKWMTPARDSITQKVIELNERKGLLTTNLSGQIKATPECVRRYRKAV